MAPAEDISRKIVATRALLAQYVNYCRYFFRSLEFGAQDESQYNFPTETLIGGSRLFIICNGVEKFAITEDGLNVGKIESQDGVEMFQSAEITPDNFSAIVDYVLTTTRCLRGRDMIAIKTQEFISDLSENIAGFLASAPSFPEPDVASDMDLLDDLVPTPMEVAPDEEEDRRSPVAAAASATATVMEVSLLSANAGGARRSARSAALKPVLYAESHGDEEAGAAYDFDDEGEDSDYKASSNDEDLEPSGGHARSFAKMATVRAKRRSRSQQPKGGTHIAKKTAVKEGSEKNPDDLRRLFASSDLDDEEEFFGFDIGAAAAPAEESYEGQINKLFNLLYKYHKACQAKSASIANRGLYYVLSGQEESVGGQVFAISAKEDPKYRFARFKLLRKRDGSIVLEKMPQPPAGNKSHRAEFGELYQESLKIALKFLLENCQDEELKVRITRYFSEEKITISPDDLEELLQIAQEKFASLIPDEARKGDHPEVEEGEYFKVLSQAKSDLFKQYFEYCSRHYKAVTYRDVSAVLAYQCGNEVDFAIKIQTGKPGFVPCKEDDDDDEAVIPAEVPKGLGNALFHEQCAAQAIRHCLQIAEGGDLAPSGSALIRQIGNLTKILQEKNRDFSEAEEKLLDNYFVFLSKNAPPLKFRHN